MHCESILNIKMEALNRIRNFLIDAFSQKDIYNKFGILTVVVIILFVYSYVRKNAFQKLPPGPRGIPIFGYLPFLGKEAHRTLYNLSKKYGNVFGFYLGQKYVVVLNEWESVKEAFSNPAILYRPPDVFDAIPKGLGISSFNGPVWSEQRRYSMRILKDLGLGKSIWEKMLQEEVNDVIKSLQGKEGKPVDVLELFSSSFTNNMMALLFGHRLPYNHPTTKFLSACMDALLSAFYPFSTSYFLPIICTFFSKMGFCGSNEIKMQLKKLNAHIENATKNVTQEKEISKELSFTKVYHIAVKNNEKLNIPNSFTEDSLIANNQSILIGGSDTNRLASIWLLVAMAHHPDIQSKVQEELDNVIGRESTINFSERKNIPYTYACILESLRWKTLVAVNPYRMANEDTEIQGYHIPKGTFVTANHWAIHHDPKYWQNPERFDPERFLTNGGKEINTKIKSFTPFSYGKRNCPGDHIALVSLLQYFVRFMQKCTVLPVMGDDANYDIVLGLLYRPRSIKLCFVPRE